MRACGAACGKLAQPRGGTLTLGYYDLSYYTSIYVQIKNDFEPKVESTL